MIKYILYNTQCNKAIEIKLYNSGGLSEFQLSNYINSDIYYIVKENGNEKELILNYKCYNYSVDNIKEITESIYKKGFIYDN